MTDSDNDTTDPTTFHAVATSAMTVGHFIGSVFPENSYPPGAPGTPMKPRLRGKLLDEQAILHEIGCANGDVLFLIKKRSAMRRPSLEKPAAATKRKGSKGSFDSKYAVMPSTPAPAPALLSLPVVGSLVREAPELNCR